MKICARNQLKGVIKSLKENGASTVVKIELPSGDLITSIITSEGATDLGLEVGKEAYAVFMSSAVMIGVDD